MRRMVSTVLLLCLLVFFNIDLCNSAWDPISDAVIKTVSLDISNDGGDAALIGTSTSVDCDGSSCTSTCDCIYVATGYSGGLRSFAKNSQTGMSLNTIAYSLSSTSDLIAAGGAVYTSSNGYHLFRFF